MILKFEPWPVCSISTLFWKSLASKKLNDFGKGRNEAPLKAFYLPPSCKSSSLFFSTESFDSTQKITSVGELGANFITLNGHLILCDTIEEFKALDRLEEASIIAKHNSTCESIQDIKYFLLLAFADVKKFKFYYQIIYPVQMFDTEQLQFEIINSTESDNSIDSSEAVSIDIEGRKIHFKDCSAVDNITLK